MKLLEFTAPSGASVYLNPELVIRVYRNEGSVEHHAKTVIHLTDGIQGVQEELHTVIESLELYWKENDG